MVLCLAACGGKTNPETPSDEPSADGTSLAGTYDITVWAAEKVEASMMSAADFGAAMQSVMDGELPPL